MGNQITLETGVKTYDINFTDRGVTASISFNPADADLAVRFDDFKDRVMDQLKSFDDIELNANGEAKDLGFVEPLRKATQIIKDELDIAFGNAISNTIFQFCSPFALINGKYFVVQVMEAIAPIIRDEIKTESKKLEKHLGKYTK